MISPVSASSAMRPVAMLLLLAGSLAMTGCVSEAARPFGAGVQALEIAAEPGSGRPRLTRSGKGEVLLSWTEPVGARRHRLRYAALRGSGWTLPATVAEGKDWFINWADFPSVTRSATGRLVAHFLQKSAHATFAYDVMASWSDDDGNTWTDPAAPHDDGTPTEHGFVSTAPFSDGRLALFWLDGRRTGYGEPEGEGESEGHGGHSGEMTLRYAELDRDGAFIGETEVDGRTCDCCQTAAVPLPRGVAVFYRDRSESEIRDVSVVRQIDGMWESPRTVWPDGWKIAGCPVNGPAADVDGEHVVLAWFTAAADRPAVRVAFSYDGAASFGLPVTLSLDKPLGRVDVAFIGGDAVATWLEQEGEVTSIRMQRVYANGGLGAPRSIVQTAPDRSSGFPQIAVAGRDTLVVAWTQVNGRKTRLRTALVPL